MMTSPYKIKIYNLSLFCPTFILYGFCLYFNFSSMPSLIGWWQVLMNQKWDPKTWYARTPRRLGCTTQSTWNYLRFIWLSHIFQLDSAVQPLRRGVSLCDGYNIDASIYYLFTRNSMVTFIFAPDFFDAFLTAFCIQLQNSIFNIPDL